MIGKELISLLFILYNCSINEKRNLFMEVLLANYLAVCLVVLQLSVLCDQIGY